ncbi:methyltransferase [Pontixanthobacter aestiaquae]|uniref:Methyltransferase n=1 Tax=Pontixanthobacter aestiaquae TaxID=1509367 RepID=A0A844ZAA2_9SPHN|nr:methyltransferase [Pontixanthobacter aestiaquae]MDN3644761.1 methyltransferase [Pontixanthobacter aestiaquae]MXO84232.1 methyltransferase [Pontixanthobacter aestiaquae]
MSNIKDSELTTPNWRTRWALCRNRVLGSQRFQNWAAKTLIFRRIARRKAAGQFHLIAGFVYTQITYVFVQSGLIDFLREGPRQFDDVAEFLGFQREATDRILKAGAALKLCESPQYDLWLLGEVGAALSVNEGAMAMVRHHALLYRDMADPMALLSRQGGVDSELSQFWTYAQDREGGATPYSELMQATQPMVWEQIIGRYSFRQHRKMLDIGGGSGAFVEAVAGTAPRIELGIFDLADVAHLAEARFANTPLEKRVTIHSGSFRADPIPLGYDLVTLIRILHDHNDDVAAQLLKAVYESLAVGGRLLIAEPMAETRLAEGMGDAYFGMYLWAMGSGRPRSSTENRKMLKNAGFSGVKAINTPLPIIAQALVAHK